MPQVQVVRIYVNDRMPVGLVFGQIVDDPTKVAVAMMEVEGALLLAAEAHRQEGPFILDMPDEAVFEILELP